MHATRKVKLKDLTPNLTCNLCHGYFVDATTIIECLHSFCRSCIIQHLEKSEYCPVCDVHCSSKPLTSIRSDQMLQEIVYKLVPGLFQSEMTKRREFYKQNQTFVPTNQHDGGHTNESYITSDDIIQLSLEYYTTDRKFRETTKRYVKCPAAVSIGILKKLIHGKYDLNNSVQVDVMYGDRILPEDFLLMDIAYKYSWTQNGNKPLELSYRVKGLAAVGDNDKKLAASRQKLRQTPKISKKVNGGVTTQATSASSNGPDRKRQKNVKSVMTPVNSNGPTVVKRRNSKAGAIAITATPSVPPKFKLPPKDERKRKLSREIEMELIIESNNNDDKSPIKKQARYEPNNNEHEMMITNESGTEVQLRISENGVISATSIINTPNYDRIGNRNAEEKVILNVPKKSLKSCLKTGLIPNEKTSRSINASEHFGKGNQKRLVNGSHEISQEKATVKKVKLGRKPMKIEKISNGMNEAIASAKLKGKKQNHGVGRPKLKKLPVPGPGAIRLSMSGSPNEKSYANGHQTSNSNKLLQQLQSPKKSSSNTAAVNAGVMKIFHTSTQNGNLKFTSNSSPLKCTTKASSTSPIKLPQNVNGVEIIPIGAPNLTPTKKPPKFFKSRASITELPAPVPNSPCLTPNGDHRTDFTKSTTTSPSSAVTDTITNSTTSLFSTLNLLQTNTASSANHASMKSSSCSLSPNSTSGANTIETTATTSVMVPIPMSSSYNSSSQMYRFPAPAATTTTLPWTANTPHSQCPSSMLMNHNIPLNVMPYNLMPYYSMQNSALQFTAAAIQQQMHLQQMQQQQRNGLAAQLISSSQGFPGTNSGPNCMDSDSPGLNYSALNDNNNTLDLSPSNRKQQQLQKQGVNGDDGAHVKKVSRHPQEQIDAHNKSPPKKTKLTENGKAKATDSNSTPTRVSKHNNNSPAQKRSKKTSGMSPSHRSPKHIAPAISSALTAANMATILQIPSLLMAPEIVLPLPRKNTMDAPSLSSTESVRQNLSTVSRPAEINIQAGSTEIPDSDNKEGTDVNMKSAVSSGSSVDGNVTKTKLPDLSVHHESDAKEDKILLNSTTTAVSDALAMKGLTTNIANQSSQGATDPNPTATSAFAQELSRNENSCSPALVIAEPDPLMEKTEDALPEARSPNPKRGSKLASASTAEGMHTASILIGGKPEMETVTKLKCDDGADSCCNGPFVPVPEPESVSSPAPLSTTTAIDINTEKQAPTKLPTPEVSEGQTEL